MDHWVKRGPFLEVNVDELVRHDPGRRLDSLVSTVIGDGLSRLGQRARRYIGGEFPLVHQLASKGICRS